MDKETSSRVSSIASKIMRTLPISPDDDMDSGIAKDAYNNLLDDAKTLAGSCMSQDETPGQEKPAGDFLSRLKAEREDLDARLIALNSYLTNNPDAPNQRHRNMLQRQSYLMSDLLAVLDERLADLAIDARSTEAEKIDGE